MTTFGAPVDRTRAAFAWTGSRFVIWGGAGEPDAAPRIRNDGALYDPQTDTWAAMSNVGAPTARWLAASVWTGSELLIWSGALDFFAPGPSPADDGAAYDPIHDSWRPIASAPGSPTTDTSSAVWTGTEMIVWNGVSGAAYDPMRHSWRRISRDTGIAFRVGNYGNRFPAIVWTGTEMIEWGGGGRSAITRIYGDGARYDPTTDTWSPISARGAPAATDMHSMVWTGDQVLIWPGGDGSAGGSYRPTWLTVRASTPLYSPTMDPLRDAQPGERYRVVEQDPDWALVQLLGDPPALQEWIAIDDSVELTAPIPAQVRG
jgi:N-acetylneuraminic acid mutarotase